MIQERRGMLKVWNVSLVIVTFILTMIGTFMTRSGIVQSVHAFGQDTELAIIFLIFISSVLIFSFGMVIYRLPLLRARNELDSWLSREFSFVINNWVLLSAAFFVLVATLFPTLSEWVTHERITVGAPFFTKWMAPMGLILLFLTGVGPLIAWRKATPENLREQFAFPATAAFAVMIGLQAIPSLRGWWMTRILVDKIPVGIPVTPSVLCFGLAGFVFATISQEFYRGTRVRQAHTGLDLFTSLIGLVARGKRRYGGYLVHLAIVLMFIGFAGDAYKQETEATLAVGKTVTLGHYTVRFDGLEFDSDASKEMTSAKLTVTKDGQPFSVEHPAKWAFYHHEDEPPTSEVAIHRMLPEDLYLVLNGYEGNPQIANVKVVINPLVNWIWLGFLLLAAGTFIAFMPDRAYALAGAKIPPKGAGAAAAVAGLLVVLALGGAAHAQNADTPMARANDPALARNDGERDLFKKIVCQCGTCGRQVLADCACSTAADMRRAIQKLIDQGKTPDQVIEYELQTYPGQSALVVPIDRGFNRIAWLLPYGMTIFGVGGIVLLGRRWSKRSAPSAEVAKADASTALSEEDRALADRLDDELDELD
jgi:cytochrome c-type biogenesis protein CcmF